MWFQIQINKMWNKWRSFLWKSEKLPILSRKETPNKIDNKKELNQVQDQRFLIIVLKIQKIRHFCRMKLSYDIILVIDLKILLQNRVPRWWILKFRYLAHTRCTSSGSFKCYKYNAYTLHIELAKKPLAIHCECFT